MAAHASLDSPLWFLLLLAISIAVLYYVVRWVRRSLGKLGLSQGEVGAILWATFIGGMFNVPLFAFGDGFIGINIGGGVIPVLLSIVLIKRKRLPLTELIVGIPAVAIVAYLVTDYDPALGVIARFPYWLLPALTAFVFAALAYWHERAESAALAYVMGTLGVLIGADLVRLPEILAGPPPAPRGILAIGGAAVFDMVYLTGLIAITMETGLLVKLRHDLSRPGRSNPIEAEYLAWVAKKERQWAEIDAERRRRGALKGDARTTDAAATRSARAANATPRGQPSGRSTVRADAVREWEPIRPR